MLRLATDVEHVRQQPDIYGYRKSQMLEQALEGVGARVTVSFTFSAESYGTILQVLADSFGDQNQAFEEREAKLREVASKPLGSNPTSAQLRDKHIEICNQRQDLLI